jgi:hypothetical protein
MISRPLMLTPAVRINCESYCCSGPCCCHMKYNRFSASPSPCRR